MAIRTYEEIIEIVKNRIGEDNSDEALAFVEDITDTLNDMNSRTAESDKWKTKYEENDKVWRERYKNRFFGAEDETPPDDEIIIDEKKTYSDLFKVEE